MSRRDGIIHPHQHGTATGYAYGCRESCCRAAKAAERRKMLENPEIRERAVEATRKWRKDNPDQARASNAKRDPDAKRAAYRKWADLNPAARDTMRRRNDRRRARVRDAYVEDICPTTVFEDDNWTCHICGVPVDPSATFPNPSAPSIDHVMPLARGGLHERANVATAHLGCNMRKHASVPA